MEPFGFTCNITKLKSIGIVLVQYELLNGLCYTMLSIYWPSSIWIFSRNYTPHDVEKIVLKMIYINELILSNYCYNHYNINRHIDSM